MSHGSVIEITQLMVTPSKVERGKKSPTNFGPQLHKLKHMESKYLLAVKGYPTQVEKMQQRMYLLQLKHLQK